VPISDAFVLWLAGGVYIISPSPQLFVVAATSQLLLKPTMHNFLLRQSS
jgi:hypothetical protein